MYTSDVTQERTNTGGDGLLDTSYLDTFNLLQKTGALDDLAGLREENRELDRLINDAASLFALFTIDEMIGFVISRLLERFIPARLVFLVERLRGDGIDQYYYENLKPAEARLPESCYPPLKEYFSLSPYPSLFSDMEGAIGAIDAELAGFAPVYLLPMRGIGGLHGIVILGEKVVGGEYTELERMYVDRMTRFLAIGIQNSLSHQSSITDPKTELYNHAYFMQRLEQELARIGRYNARAGLIMIDVDHFKRFNDTWGHLAGDEVLISLAKSLKSHVRSEDVAARFGGEEFCILAIECGESDLVNFAERLRRSVETMVVTYKSERLSVTISLGLCLLDSESPTDGPGCLERADRALYKSKSFGRNRATLYRPGLLDRAMALRER